MGTGGRVRDGLLGRAAGTPLSELLGGGQGLNLVAEKAGKTADFAEKVLKTVATGEARCGPLGKSLQNTCLCYPQKNSLNLLEEPIR